MDGKLVEYLAERFQSETRIDVRNDRKAMARLREAGEMAKIELSTSI